MQLCRLALVIDPDVRAEQHQLVESFRTRSPEIRRGDHAFPAEYFAPSRLPLYRGRAGSAACFFMGHGGLLLFFSVVLGFRGLAAAFLGFALARLGKRFCPTADSVFASTLASGFALALAEGLAPPVQESQ